MVLVRLMPGREEKAAFCHDTVNNCKINYIISNCYKSNVSKS